MGDHYNKVRAEITAASQLVLQKAEECRKSRLEAKKSHYIMCAHQFRFSKHVIDAKKMIEREEIATEVRCKFCSSQVTSRELVKDPEFRKQTEEEYENLRCWGFHCSEIPGHGAFFHSMVDLRKTWACCPKRFLESHELALMQLVNLKLKYNFDLGDDFEDVEKEVVKRIGEMFAEEERKHAK